MVTVQIKRMYEDALIPTQGSDYAAGADLYAYLPGDKLVEIAPHETVMIGSGIAAAIPREYWGGVFARSGLASKYGLFCGVSSGANYYGLKEMRKKYGQDKVILTLLPDRGERYLSEHVF